MDDWSDHPRQYPAQHDERPWIEKHWVAIVLALVVLTASWVLLSTDRELGRALDSNSVAEECGVDGDADC